MLCISGSAWHGFDPFGDVIYGDQNILASLGSYKWSHVIKTPDIEKFNLKIVVQGHWIASCDPSMPLAVWTSADEVLCIFIHRWPIETTLPDFRLSAKYTIVTSIWCRMAFLLWSFVLLPWVHNVWVTHLHRLGTDMVHPIGGVCSRALTSFCFPLGVYTPKPWSLRYSHTRGAKLLHWEAYHPVWSHYRRVLDIRVGHAR